MIAINNKFRGVVLDAPVRDARHVSPTSRFVELIRRTSRMIKSDPLVVLIGFFDAIFYGGVVALLVSL
ncbi:MAG TPA: hypothetical protein VGH03_12750 [Caulobacteraceae bacterium]|jgi:hypothetical protein